MTSQYKYEVIFKYTVRSFIIIGKNGTQTNSTCFTKKKKIIRKQNTNTKKNGIKPLLRLIAKQNREQNNQVQQEIEEDIVIAIDELLLSDYDNSLIWYKIYQNLFV